MEVNEFYAEMIIVFAQIDLALMLWWLTVDSCQSFQFRTPQK